MTSLLCILGAERAGPLSPLWWGQASHWTPVWQKYSWCLKERVFRLYWTCPFQGNPSVTHTTRLNV